MANWQGFARTNAFHVEDMEGLLRVLRTFGCVDTAPEDPNDRSLDVLILEAAEEGDPPGTHVLLCNLDGGSGTPSEGGFRFQMNFPEDPDEEEMGFDPARHVMPFVREGEVVIFMDVGHEKLAYVGGWARAYIRRNGVVEEPVVLDLDLIHALAAQTFNVPVESIDRISQPGTGFEEIDEGGDDDAPPHPIH